MDRKLRVFISSTSDLAEERKALAEGLPPCIEGYRYEKDRPRKQSPRDRLLDVLEQTDVFVGILGTRYGSVYPNCAGDPSIVEWEFKTASDKDIELLGYRKEGIDPAAIEEPQREFLERLGHFVEGHWLCGFRSAEDLKLRVKDALLEWLAEFRLRLGAKEVEARSSLQRLLGPTAVLAMIALLVAIHIGPNPESLLYLIIAVVVVIVGCILLLKL